MTMTTKYLVLIVAVMAVCAVTVLSTNKAAAQSDLLFSVSRQMSYQAPSLDSVFAPVAPTQTAQTVSTVSYNVPVVEDSFSDGMHFYEPNPAVLVNAMLASLEAETPEKRVDVDPVMYSHSSQMAQMTLLFPVAQQVSYQAPGLDNAPTSTIRTNSSWSASYSPTLDAVFAG